VVVDARSAKMEDAASNTAESHRAGKCTVGHCDARVCRASPHLSMSLLNRTAILYVSRCILLDCRRCEHHTLPGKS
jgi:hypothetical protein